jgi:hypothetical protein
MRYADDTNPLQAPPAVPSIPSAYTSQQPHYQSAAQRNHHPASDVGALARRPTIDASNGQGGGGASMWGEDAGTGGGRAGAYDSGLDLESVGMAGIGVRKGSMAAGEDERMGRRGGITLDLSLLGKEGFDAEACTSFPTARSGSSGWGKVAHVCLTWSITDIKSKLAGASSEEIRNFAKALESSKAATSTDLQRNVFKNYAEFVVISKEIATLENDMLELKDLLGEWKGVPEALVGLELDDPILGSASSLLSYYDPLLLAADSVFHSICAASEKLARPPQPLSPNPLPTAAPPSSTSKTSTETSSSPSTTPSPAPRSSSPSYRVDISLPRRPRSSSSTRRRTSSRALCGCLC